MKSLKEISAIIAIMIVSMSISYSQDLDEILKNEKKALTEMYKDNNKGRNFEITFLGRMAKAIEECELKRTCEIVRHCAELVSEDEGTESIKNNKYTQIIAKAVDVDFEHSALIQECMEMEVDLAETVGTTGPQSTAVVNQPAAAAPVATPTTVTELVTTASSSTPGEVVEVPGGDGSPTETAEVTGAVEVVETVTTTTKTTTTGDEETVETTIVTERTDGNNSEESTVETNTL